jgi:hypothetical protein
MRFYVLLDVMRHLDEISCFLGADFVFDCVM